MLDKKSQKNSKNKTNPKPNSYPKWHFLHGLFQSDTGEAMGKRQEINEEITLTSPTHS